MLSQEESLSLSLPQKLQLLPCRYSSNLIEIYVYMPRLYFKISHLDCSAPPERDVAACIAENGNSSMSREDLLEIGHNLRGFSMLTS